jgi:hypothetical protein
MNAKIKPRSEVSDTELDEIFKRMSPSPNFQFRTLGDELAGHDAVMLVTGMRAAQEAAPAAGRVRPMMSKPAP